MNRKAPWDIVATFEVLQCDSGFTAMSSGVRVPSEFAVHTFLVMPVNDAPRVLWRGVEVQSAAAAGSRSVGGHN